MPNSNKPTSLNDTRVRKLTQVLERHWINPSSDSPGAQEICEYLDGRSSCATYAIVTAAPGPDGKPTLLLNADHSSFVAATQTALFKVAAKDWIEVPIEIVNLDTGERWLPDFSQTPWSIAKAAAGTSSEANLMKPDQSVADYQPLHGITSDRLAALYPIHSEIRLHNFASATIALQVHAEAKFASSFNKLARRYRAGIPISGQRMRKLVRQAAALARTEPSSELPASGNDEHD